MKNTQKCYVLYPLLILLCFSCSKSEYKSVKVPSRIVSFAPSVTETLFALGLGKKVVGVTTFCNFPDEAKRIEKIGGYSEINIEKVISLKPDLVILQQEHRKQIDFLQKMGIAILVVKYGNCSSICNSIASIGKVCGAEKKADSIIQVFNKRLNRINTGKYRPKILLSVGRDSPGSGVIEGIFAAGESTFYNDIIVAAGGVNVYSDSIPQYPRISKEGIITIKPDIVIDLTPSMGGIACSTLVSDWQSIPMIPAVKNNRVFCISDDYATIPGPRIIFLLDNFTKIVQSYCLDSSAGN